MCMACIRNRTAFALHTKVNCRLKSNPKLTLGDVTTTNMNKIEGGVQINVVPAEMHACNVWYIHICEPTCER